MSSFPETDSLSSYDESMEVIPCSLDTPLGKLRGEISGRGVRKLVFVDPEQVSEDDLASLREGRAIEEETASLLAQLERELLQYCSGDRRSFSVPLDLEGTPFQLRVWHRLRSIPYGATVTYKQLASELNLSNGSRAVGSAVARNPLLILVPCHRVLGTSGRLTGFAAGLELKERLLELEGARIPFGYTAG